MLSAQPVEQNPALGIPTGTERVSNGFPTIPMAPGEVSGPRAPVPGLLLYGASWQVWAERFDRDATDLFTVQDEITELVVGALEPELGFVERRRVRLAPPKSLDAWGHHQRDLDHMYRRTEEHDALAAQDIRRQLLWPVSRCLFR